MDTKTAKAILFLFLEGKKMERAIRSEFKFTPKSRIRRGVVANAVALSMGVNRNHTFYKSLKAAVVAMGGREIRVDGRSYWGNISYHPDINEQETPGDKCE